MNIPDWPTNVTVHPEEGAVQVRLNGETVLYLTTYGATTLAEVLALAADVSLHGGKVH